MENILAIGGFDINDGSGSGHLSEMTIEWQEFPPPWIGTGGELYDVYIWFDLNDNFPAVQYPEEGFDRRAIHFPYDVFIDGDIILILTGEDFEIP